MSPAPEAMPSDDAIYLTNCETYADLQINQLETRLAHIKHLQWLVTRRYMPPSLITPDLISEQQGIQAELDSRDREPEDFSRLRALTEANKSLWGPPLKRTGGPTSNISSKSKLCL